MTISDEASGDLAEAQQALQQLLEDALVALNHELRTPLAAMKGYATTLLKHDRRLTRQERLSMLQEIDRACDRLLAVIEQAAQASRMAGESVVFTIEPVDISLVAHEAIAEITALLGAERSMSRTILVRVSDSATPIVLGDALHLRQVMLRLLDNALRFSLPETPVEIAVTRESPHSPEGSGMTIVVRVRDHGVGIPQEMAERIFDPFFRAESGLVQLTSGLGLGLTYCQRTIERHGGTIWCEPAPEGGTIFAFRLAAA